MNTVTLPRAALEQALKLLDALSYNENYDYDGCFQHWADYARPEKLALQFRAALEQSQDHVPDAGKMVPTGWKLVPVEPTKDMKAAGAFAAMDQVRRSYNPPSAYIPVDSMALLSYRAMIATAPQRPVVKDSLTVGQPQPQQPLTDEQVMQAVRHLYQSDVAAGMGFPDDLYVARAIEAAHGIGE